MSYLKSVFSKACGKVSEKGKGKRNQREINCKSYELLNKVVKNYLFGLLCFIPIVCISQNEKLIQEIDTQIVRLFELQKFNPNLTITRAKEQLRLADSIQYQEGIHQFTYLLGHIHVNYHRYTEAESYFNKCLVNALKSKEKVNEATAKVELANLKFNQGFILEANRYLDDALDIANKKNFGLIQAWCYELKAFDLFLSGELVKSEETYNKAIETLLRFDRRDLIENRLMWVYNGIINLTLFQRNHVKAIQYVDKLNHLAEKNRDTIVMSLSLMHKYEVYASNGKASFSQMKEILDDAKFYAERRNSYDYLVTINQYFIELYTKNEDYKMADEAFQRGIECFDLGLSELAFDLKNNHKFHQLKQEYAISLLERGNSTDALKEMKPIIENPKVFKIKRKPTLLKYYKTIGKIYERHEEPLLARDYFVKAYDLAVYFDIAEEKKDVGYGLLSTITENDSSFLTTFYLDEYITANEEVVKKSFENNINEEIEKDKKKRLDKERKIKQEQYLSNLRQDKYSLIYVIVIILVIMVFSLILFLLQRKKVKELKEREQTINNQKKQLRKNLGFAERTIKTLETLNDQISSEPEDDISILLEDAKIERSNISNILKNIDHRTFRTEEKIDGLSKKKRVFVKLKPINEYEKVTVDASKIIQITTKRSEGMPKPLENGHSHVYYQVEEDGFYYQFGKLKDIIKTFELQNLNFVRTHDNRIINLDYLEGYSGGQITMIQEAIPRKSSCSETYDKLVKNKLGI